MTVIHSKNELMHEILSTPIRVGKWLSFPGTKMVVQLFPTLEIYNTWGRARKRTEAIKARQRLLNKVRCRTPKKLWAA